MGNYWNQTETFEALRIYIDMNFEGLKDDVLTLLIHLGYVSYDYDSKTVKIPNEEVRELWKGVCRSCFSAKKKIFRKVGNRGRT